MSKIISGIMFVAITIILALFIGYGIETFYKTPKYEDYCNVAMGQFSDTKEKCEMNNGTWVVPETKTSEMYLVCDVVEENLKERNGSYNCRTITNLMGSGYCDYGVKSYCMDAYQKKIESHNRNVFVITLIFGIIGVLVVGFWLQWNVISAGILGGSVLTIIYGTIRYWGLAPDYIRFGILTIALVVLLFIGYKKVVKAIDSKNKK